MNDNTQQQTTPTPEGTGGKMFTQDEVNKIVSDRLARERECQRQLEIVRKRQRNFVVFRRGG